MGYNTVAVLLNDFTHEIESSPDFGKRLAQRMRDWSPVDGNRHSGPHQTRVVSRDHSSGYQVICVHGNTGWRVEDPLYDKCFGDGSWQAFKYMKECLERHGYKVTKAKTKAPA